MTKKITSIILAALLAFTTLALTACGGSDSSSSSSSDSDTASGNDVTIAIPNDPTNEARALMLLDANGYIKLKDGASITATIQDVEDANGITFQEIEAAQIPNTLQDVDFGIINSNYAIDAGLNPVEDSLLIEGSAADYANIIAVKEGNENTDKTKALVAAVTSQKVVDFIEEEYQGAIVSVITDPTDGYDDTVDYDALAGQTITVAASPTPHAEILAVAKEILAEKNVTLEILEFTDYVQPNNVVESGEVDANYFQHLPYLEDFNEENGTHIVSVAAVHNEPMGLYAGKTTTLDGVKKLSE
ncbi:MAG: MetQ/NlpA family ABC transporter substrate-binding protein [Eubacterium sp.]|jgi:D-methionine transport system substrate-binding protein